MTKNSLYSVGTLPNAIFFRDLAHSFHLNFEYIVRWGISGKDSPDADFSLHRVQHGFHVVLLEREIDVVTRLFVHESSLQLVLRSTEPIQSAFYGSKRLFECLSCFCGVDKDPVINSNWVLKRAETYSCNTIDFGDFMQVFDGFQRAICEPVRKVTAGR